jgi:hypothetical protein
MKKIFYRVGFDSLELFAWLESKKLPAKRKTRKKSNQKQRHEKLAQIRAHTHK